MSLAILSCGLPVRKAETICEFVQVCLCHTSDMVWSGKDQNCKGKAWKLRRVCLPSLFLRSSLAACKLQAAS